jgi:hypothetical protein
MAQIPNPGPWREIPNPPARSASHSDAGGQIPSKSQVPNLKSETTPAAHLFGFSAFESYLGFGTWDLGFLLSGAR